jgi:3-oxoacyl-[acyl-carrier-protein] synthase III
MDDPSSMRDRTCIVGIGETAYTRGTKKSALELASEASLLAIEDAGAKPEIIDAVILPGAAGGGGTAGDFIANLGLPDLHYTTSLQVMDGAMCVSALECATTALASDPLPRAGRRRARGVIPPLAVLGGARGGL